MKQYRLYAHPYEMIISLCGFQDLGALPKVPLQTLNACRSPPLLRIANDVCLFSLRSYFRCLFVLQFHSAAQISWEMAYDVVVQDQVDSDPVDLGSDRA